MLSLNPSVFCPLLFFPSSISYWNFCRLVVTPGHKSRAIETSNSVQSALKKTPTCSKYLNFLILCNSNLHWNFTSFQTFFSSISSFSSWSFALFRANVLICCWSSNVIFVSSPPIYKQPQKIYDFLFSSMKESTGIKRQKSKIITNLFSTTPFA